MHPRKLVTLTIETKDDGSLYWRCDPHIAGGVELQGAAVPSQLGTLLCTIALRFNVRGQLVADLASPSGQSIEVHEDEGVPLEPSPAVVLTLTRAERDSEDVDVDPDADTVVDGDAVDEGAACSRCGMALLLCACALTH